MVFTWKSREPEFPDQFLWKLSLGLQRIWYLLEMQISTLVQNSENLLPREAAGSSPGAAQPPFSGPAWHTNSQDSIMNKALLRTFRDDWATRIIIEKWLFIVNPTTWPHSMVEPGWFLWDWVWCAWLQDWNEWWDKQGIIIWGARRWEKSYFLEPGEEEEEEVMVE